MKILARAAKLELLRYCAERRVCGFERARTAAASRPPAFIVGCGRSGTTILGKLLGFHSAIEHFCEPWHLWATVDPLNDASNLFYRLEGRLLRDREDATDKARRRFQRLFLDFAAGKGKLVVEKTPQNAMRVGYLDALAPGSKFIHIVRDGGDVCRSIARLASLNYYKILGRPSFNMWWGVNDAKWTALLRDGKAAGYHPSEVDQLTTHFARGAYEWLVSLGEIDRLRSRLGDRLCEITFDELITTPREVLERLAAFLEIAPDSAWLARGVSLIDPPPRRAPHIDLPPEMSAAFNYYQERFDFHWRANSRAAA